MGQHRDDGPHDLTDLALGATVDASDLGSAPTAHATPDGRPEGGEGRRLRRGESLGRYVVLDLLGAGAMGAVYTAYDPELDRRVALKVVRHAAPSEAVRQQGRGRLVREAQSMARLSHPNVIHVYDVGTVGEDVYIAMEHVEGASLRDWLAAEPRRVAEILDVYLQAARGLAHAHAAGVVHRDFKPDNCLVGADGRVRVIDFGIARHEAAPSEERAPDAAELARPVEGSPAALAQMVETRAGVLIGTPAYMAPEQLEGRGADARSDQFAFCVALYEALYARRPFDGEGVLQIIGEVTSGRLRPPPRDPRVPEHVAEAITRGLARDPGARFASMDALIAALAPPERRAGARWLAVGALAVAVGLAVALAFGRPAADEGACRGLERHLEGVWDAGATEAVREAFAGSGVPFAEESFARVRALLDERAARWVAMREEACEATRVAGEQSEEVLELRMACLDRRLRELDEVVRVLRHADADRVRRSTQLAGDLPPVARCADVDRLRADAAHEPPPDAREAVQRLSRRLARLRALTEAGDYERAAPLAEELVAAARATGFAPIEAEAHFRRSRVRVATGDLRGARDDLLEAARLADRGHDLEGEAAAWIDLVFVVGSKLREREEALRWARFARSTLDELGDAPLLSGRLRYDEGLVQGALGHHDRALAAFADTERDYRRILPADHWRLAVVHGARASALNQLGRTEEALAEHRRAIDGMRSALGARHPNVAPLLNNYASALRRADRLDEARAAYREALELKRATLGADHPSVAVTLVNLGALEQRLGRYERAAALFGEARALRRRTLGESHALYASAVGYEAELALDRERWDEGVEGYRRALTLAEARGDAWAVARATNDVAWALMRAGRLAEAEPLARQALEALVAREVEPRLIAFPRTVLGTIQVERGRPAEAVGPLTLALRARTEAHTDPEHLALTQYALGRALYESGRDPARGYALVARARTTFERAHARGRWGRARAEAWLAAHERPEAVEERR
jgi:tetratricopeptide (TPR) repeat protein/tRNA A-37 threonylcarbamoyl transferase component Bud32